MRCGFRAYNELLHAMKFHPQTQMLTIFQRVIYRTSRNYCLAGFVLMVPQTYTYREVEKGEGRSDWSHLSIFYPLKLNTSTT